MKKVYLVLLVVCMIGLVGAGITANRILTTDKETKDYYTNYKIDYETSCNGEFCVVRVFILDIENKEVSRRTFGIKDGLSQEDFDAEFNTKLDEVLKDIKNYTPNTVIRDSGGVALR